MSKIWYCARLSWRIGAVIPSLIGSGCENMVSTDVLTCMKRWRFALLGLLCVVGSQLVLAGHQFQHDELLVVESCAVCAQLEQLYSPVPGAAVVVAFPAPLTEDFPAIDRHRGNRTATFYFGRAPPVPGSLLTDGR